MTKDWRLTQLEPLSYLRGVAFVRKRYRAPSPEWDHDYCTACWATLAEPTIKAIDTIHEGYTTTSEFVRGADYDWICVRCFDQLSEIMEWRVVALPMSG